MNSKRPLFKRYDPLDIQTMFGTNHKRLPDFGAAGSSPVEEGVRFVEWAGGSLLKQIPLL